MAYSEIECNLSQEKSKFTMTVSKDVLKEWNEFTKGNSQKWIIASAALKHFMQDYKDGNVDLKITF